MTQKKIPVILTDADWQKKKGIIAKAAGETGIGKAMKAVEVEWKKVDWEDLDPNAAWNKTGLQRNPVNYAKVFNAAKAEYSKIAAVRSKVKTLADLAEKTEAKFKSSKLIPSSSREHVGKIAKEADRLWIELKSIDQIWTAEEKAVKLHYNTKLKQTADNLGKAIPIVLGRADKFVEAVKKDPKPKTFNDGMPKVARDITQQIGNVEKILGEGIDVGKPVPKNELAGLKPWGNDGRKVDDKANATEVLAEVALFEKAVDAVKDWWK
jgi:hypothetical protein